MLAALILSLSVQQLGLEPVIPESKLAYYGGGSVPALLSDDLSLVYGQSEKSLTVANLRTGKSIYRENLFVVQLANKQTSVMTDGQVGNSKTPTLALLIGRPIGRFADGTYIVAGEEDEKFGPKNNWAAIVRPDLRGPNPNRLLASRWLSPGTPKVWPCGSERRNETFVAFQNQGQRSWRIEQWRISPSGQRKVTRLASNVPIRYLINFDPWTHRILTVTSRREDMFWNVVDLTGKQRERIPFPGFQDRPFRPGDNAPSTFFAGGKLFVWYPIIGDRKSNELYVREGKTWRFAGNYQIRAATLDRSTLLLADNDYNLWLADPEKLVSVTAE